MATERLTKGQWKKHRDRLADVRLVNVEGSQELLDEVAVCWKENKKLRQTLALREAEVEQLQRRLDAQFRDSARASND